MHLLLFDTHGSAFVYQTYTQDIVPYATASFTGFFVLGYGRRVHSLLKRAYGKAYGSHSRVTS